MTVSERYFQLDDSVAVDPIGGERPKTLRYGVGGTWKVSTSAKYMNCYDPSTGAVIARAPQCTAAEVEAAIEAAVRAYPAWRDTPVTSRAQVMFKMKALLDEHLDELTRICVRRRTARSGTRPRATSSRSIEVVEFACGAPHLMKGESLFNVSTGYDTVQFREPMGVFAGIAPWNFPAMIPQGWMVPICVVTGNCMVLKAASYAPQMRAAHHRAVEGGRAFRMVSSTS